MIFTKITARKQAEGKLMEDHSMRGKCVKIVAEENRRRFEVVIHGRCDADKVHIDGNPVYESNCIKCDYAIRVTPTKRHYFFFVELKGSDIPHAIKQLIASMENYPSLYSGYSDKSAWVISGGWSPAINTTFQSQQKKIEKRFGFKLLHKTRTKTIEISV